MQIHRDRKENRFYQGMEEAEGGSDCFNGYRVFPGGDEKVWGIDSDNSSRTL